MSQRNICMARYEISLKTLVCDVNRAISKQIEHVSMSHEIKFITFRITFLPSTVKRYQNCTKKSHLCCKILFTFLKVL